VIIRDFPVFAFLNLISFISCSNGKNVKLALLYALGSQSVLSELHLLGALPRSFNIPYSLFAEGFVSALELHSPALSWGALVLITLYRDLMIQLLFTSYWEAFLHALLS
jgi:hypothetical protein